MFHRVDQNRTEKRENKDADTLSDCLKAETPARSPPPNFKITEEMRKWAEKNNPTVDIAKSTDKFVRYEFSKPKSDWIAAWQNWIQREAEYQDRFNGSSAKPSHREELLRLGKLLEIDKGPDESDTHYVKRVESVNKRRMDKLDS